MIALNAVDFHAGHNKLRGVAERLFDTDIKKGIFIYRNRRNTDVKCIFYNGTGFFVGHQKLSKGRLKWWPRTEEEAGEVSAAQVTRLLMGFDPRGNWHPDWESIGERKIQNRTEGPGSHQETTGVR